MGELDGQLRFAAAGQLSFGRVPELGLPNAAQAHQGHTAGRFGASLAKLVENVAAVDEIAVPGEGDDCKGGWLGFGSFCRSVSMTKTAVPIGGIITVLTATVDGRSLGGEPFDALFD